VLLPAWGVVIFGSYIDLAVWFCRGCFVLAHDGSLRDDNAAKVFVVGVVVALARR
jgi:hypothetical protein